MQMNLVTQTIKGLSRGQIPPNGEHSPGFIEFRFIQCLDHSIGLTVMSNAIHILNLQNPYPVPPSLFSSKFCEGRVFHLQTCNFSKYSNLGANYISTKMKVFS